MIEAGTDFAVEGFPNVRFARSDHGLRSLGARRVLGAEIELANADAPWDIQAAAARGLLEVVAEGASVAHGDTFGPESGTFLARVEHLAPGTAEARYRLNLEIPEDEAGSPDPDERAAIERLATAGGAADALPYVAVPTPTSNPAAFIGYDADRPLDPNDPMDAAILRRVAELANEPSEPEPVTNMPAAPKPPASGKPGFGRRRARPSA